MDNFDLKKYLAEGRLFEDFQNNTTYDQDNPEELKLNSEIGLSIQKGLENIGSYEEGKYWVDGLHPDDLRHAVFVELGRKEALTKSIDELKNFLYSLIPGENM